MNLDYGTHTITYATREPVLASIDGKPIHTIPAGSGRFTIRNCGGKLEFDPPKAKPHIEVKTRAAGETFDDAPPPAPAAPPNYLAALRQKVKQSMGITREAFTEFKSVYEVIEDLDEFEEDRQQRQNVASQSPEETATSQSSDDVPVASTTAEESD